MTVLYPFSILRESADLIVKAQRENVNVFRTERIRKPRIRRDLQLIRRSKKSCGLQRNAEKPDTHRKNPDPAKPGIPKRNLQVTVLLLTVHPQGTIMLT